MRLCLLAILWLAFGPATASAPAGQSRTLIHAYPPTGPVEIAGAPLASKVLRTMQQHAVPASTAILALHVAYTLQGESHRPVTVTRKVRRGGLEAAAAVASAAADGHTLLLARIAQVPTSADVGLPGLDATGEFVVFAPAGTPRSIVREPAAALAPGERSAETRDVFFDFGLRLEHRGGEMGSSPRKQS